MSTRTTSSPSPMIVIIGTMLIVLAGVGTGYLLSQGSGDTTKMTASKGKVQSPGGEVEKVVGLENIQGKDDVEGTLVEGGINGEGSHHLERSGGESQNVYLVSSVIDLDNYIGMKVHVWGETNTAQTAGWFMDVVKLEVVEE